MSSQQEDWVKAITEGARNPNNWLARARGLKRSSDALFKKKQDLLPAWLKAHADVMQGVRGAAENEIFEESLSYGAPAMMLLGFAIEDYLKGLLIVRDPSVVKPPPKLFDWDHRLTVLAGQANIKLTAKESELLERLTVFTTWGGRYPAPRKPVEPEPNKEGLGPVHWSGDDLPVANDLVRRLDEILWAEILQKAQRNERR